jgi:hypothetical protein
MLKCVCLRILASSRILRYDLGRQIPHFSGGSVTTKSFIIAELKKLCQCAVLVEEVSLCIEYFTAQEHAQVRYNIVDAAQLHILIKKICPFLLIFMMLKQKNIIQLLTMNNSVTEPPQK